MPVASDPTYRAVSAAKEAANAAGRSTELLSKILSELREDATSMRVVAETTEKGLKIYKKGHMIWWEKNPDAAAYRLHLYIGKDEIDVVEVERNKAYHTFIDLVGTGIYRVEYEAEDRDGNVLDRATIEM